MEFSRPVDDLIRLRISVRTYDSKDIGQDNKEKIIMFTKKGHETVFGNKLRFGFIDASGIDEDVLGDLGTYGFINGARYFIGGTVKKNNPGKKNYCFIDFGFVFEKMLLILTDMGLGTCWLGGTYNKKGFSQRLQLEKDEIIPAVSPVGIIFKKRAIKDTLIRKLAGSNYRKSWNKLFFEEDFSNPLDKAKTGPYKEPLEMLRLAPSASNRQPWRVVKEKNTNIFHFFLQRTKNYQRGSRSVDLQSIDIGIALCHFWLTAEERGLEGKWEIEKDRFSISGDTDPDSKPEYMVSWAGK